MSTAVAPNPPMIPRTTPSCAEHGTASASKQGHLETLLARVQDAGRHGRHGVAAQPQHHGHHGLAVEAHSLKGPVHHHRQARQVARSPPAG